MEDVVEQRLLQILMDDYPHFTFDPNDSVKRTVRVRNYSICRASGAPTSFFDENTDALFGHNLYFHGDIFSWDADGDADTATLSFANIRLNKWCVLFTISVLFFSANYSKKFSQQGTHLPVAFIFIPQSQTFDFLIFNDTHYFIYSMWAFGHNSS